MVRVGAKTSLGRSERHKHEADISSQGKVADVVVKAADWIEAAWGRASK